MPIGMPMEAIEAKIAAREVNEEEIPIISGVVSFDRMNQNAYPRNIAMRFST